MIWKGGLLLVSKEENGEWRMEREKIIEKFQENYQTKSSALDFVPFFIALHPPTVHRSLVPEFPLWLGFLDGVRG